MAPEDPPPVPIDVTARLRAMGLIPGQSIPSDIPIEPRCIDPTRNRPLLSQDWDLTPDEMFRLAVNCIELERRRGYR